VSISAMGVGMSLDRPEVWMRHVLALQVLLEYGPDAASRPPVTAALIAGNALVHLLRPGAVFPRLSQVLFNPHRIIKVHACTHQGYRGSCHLVEICITAVPRFSTYMVGP
jgi:hypothetical protein